MYTYLINYHYLKGEPEAAIDYGERCLAIGEARTGRGAAVPRARLHGLLLPRAGPLSGGGGGAAAERGAARGGARRDGGAATPVSYASSTGWLAFSLAELGEFDLAASYAAMGQRAAEASATPTRRPSPGRWPGWSALRRGHMEKALYSAERAWRPAGTSSSRCGGPFRPPCSASPARAWADPRRRCRLLEDGVRLTEELGVKAYLASWTVNLAGGLLAAGNMERARETAQRATGPGAGPQGAGAPGLCAAPPRRDRRPRRPPSLARREGPHPGAGLAEELGMRPLLGRNHLGLGRVYRQAGDRAHAEDHLATASTLLSQLDMRFWFKRRRGGARWRSAICSSSRGTTCSSTST